MGNSIFRFFLRIFILCQKMLSNSSTLPLRQPQIPVFNGHSYKLWSIKMETLFKSEGLWEFVESDYVDANDNEVRQKEYQKNDAKALFFVQQAVDESLFPIIAAATSAKKAWSLLKTDYGNKMSRVDWFEAANIDVGLPEGLNEERMSQPCICMVPKIVRDRSPSCYRPRVVSIGPLHRKDENLQAWEEKKGIYAFNLLTRVEETTPKETLEACASKVYASIDKIRSCYDVEIIYNNIELAKMMVMDGCFILEVFYSNFSSSHQPIVGGDSVFSQFAFLDLLMVENQIPFFVLEDIFDSTISKFGATYLSIYDYMEPLYKCNPFIDYTIEFPDPPSSNTPDHILGMLHNCFQYQNAESSHTLDMHKAKSSNTLSNTLSDHILGLLDNCFGSQNAESTHTLKRITEMRSFLVPSVVELDRAGVKFKAAGGDREWALKMKVKYSSCSWLTCFSCSSWGNPTLIMPALSIHDNTEFIFRNLIGYEQLSRPTAPYFTSYVIVMDMLIDSREDIAMLAESKVIHNVIGSNEEAATMINNVGKDIGYFNDLRYYDKELTELNRHCNRSWPKNMAWLRRTYFNNPWNFIALLAGFALFILTVVQTFYSVNPVGGN